MRATPLLSVTRFDHIGITVPDLAEAHDFFVGVLGCEYLYRLGPYRDDGPWMREHLGVDERAVMQRLHFYRLGGQAVFEVFQYAAPGQRPGFIQFRRRAPIANLGLRRSIPMHAIELAFQRPFKEGVAVFSVVDLPAGVENVQHDVRDHLVAERVDLGHVRPVRRIAPDIGR